MKGSSLREYWWDLPMEAPKEEDSGPSGLGAFFGRNARSKEKRVRLSDWPEPPKGKTLKKCKDLG